MDTAEMVYEFQLNHGISDAAMMDALIEYVAAQEDDRALHDFLTQRFNNDVQEDNHAD